MTEIVGSTIRLRDLRRCFDGRIPAAIATANSADIPNVTYLSVVHEVDPERIAVSNQFMSKTSRNLAENPHASLLLIDPVNFAEYRLVIRYERTDRRGPVFERLRDDVDTVAALTGMRDVFRLRSADIFRVETIDVVVEQQGVLEQVSRQQAVALTACAELAARMSRCADLDGMVEVALAGLDDLLGYRHSSMMLLDEHSRRLFTLASHGFPAEGVGSELGVGEGLAGAAAEQCRPVRIGGLSQMRQYAQAVRTAYEREGAIGPGRDVPLPSLTHTESQMAVPALVRGEMVGVLLVESPLRAAFDADDEAVVTMVAALIAQMTQIERAAAEAAETPVPVETPISGANDQDVHVRFFTEDGSVFLGADYLIRGVAGRVLWSLVQRHAATGLTEFAIKELRLDKSLDLPGFRDNLDTRLVLLKRRLEERGAPIQLVRCGRGRFRMDVAGSLHLESQD